MKEGSLLSAEGRFSLSPFFPSSTNICPSPLTLFPISAGHLVNIMKKEGRKARSVGRMVEWSLGGQRGGAQQEIEEEEELSYDCQV